jgi:hypothetical protein
VAAAATRPAQGFDLESARATFERLTTALLALLPLAPPSPQATPVVYRVHCPMVKKDWLQVERTVANPYAPYMLRCGSVQGVVAGREGSTP